MTKREREKKRKINVRRKSWWRKIKLESLINMSRLKKDPENRKTKHLKAMMRKGKVMTKQDGCREE